MLESDIIKANQIKRKDIVGKSFMKIAIIGIGCIAQVHIQSILDCKQEIVALCDVDISCCERAAERFGLQTKFYTDYIKMLDEGGFDCVHICTPHYLHAEMICACLCRNINVLTEKPLAISLEQLQEIETAVKKSAATLGVCHQRRFDESIRYAKEIFTREEVVSGQGTLCWARDKAYYESGAWRGKWATEGGGVAINQALHTLDLLLWICGMPVSVIGHTANDTLKDCIEVEDTVSAIFRLENGGKFVFNATNGCNVSFPAIISVMSKNTRATVTDEWVLSSGACVKKEEELRQFGKMEWGVGHTKLIKNFYECLKSGEKFLIDFYEGQKVVKLILALYASKGEELAVL